MSHKVCSTRAIFSSQVLNCSGYSIQYIFYTANCSCNRVYFPICLLKSLANFAETLIHISTQCKKLIFRCKDSFEFRDVRIGNHIEKCTTSAMRNIGIPRLAL